MKYQGSCHCHSVKFVIESNLEKIVQCNCSICIRRNAKMIMIPKENFKLLEGSKDLSLYQFNTDVAKHFFCKICGINTHNKRRTNPNAFGVNVGCLDGFDMSWIQNVSDFTNGQEFTLENQKQGEASLQK